MTHWEAYNIELLAWFGESIFVWQSKALIMSERILVCLYDNISAEISTEEKGNINHLTLIVRK